MLDNRSTHKWGLKLKLKALRFLKKSSAKSLTKSHGEVRNEKTNLLCLSTSCHLLSEIPLEPDRAICVHSDLQWPNLPQAKQLPGLDGTSGEREKESPSGWLRKEPSDEERLEYWEEKRELEERMSDEVCLIRLLEGVDLRAFSACSSARRLFLLSSSPQLTLARCIARQFSSQNLICLLER